MRVGKEQLWIVFAAVFAYGCALLGDFVYDDLHSVRDNPAIRSLGQVPAFFWNVDLFSAVETRMYRPLVLTSLALSHAMGDGAVWAFKLGNLALHAGCALLLFAIARGARCGRRTAFWAALLFAVHPLASEAVNMISARSNQILVLGLLWGLCCQQRALRGDRRAPLWAALATAVACGGKEPGVVLPACMLAMELPRALRRGFDSPSVLRRVGPAAVVALLYLLLRRHLFGVATAAVPTLAGGSNVQTGAGRDLLTQLCTMAVELPQLLLQCIVPLGLSIDPPVYFTDRWSSAPVLAGAALLLLLTVLALRAAPRRPAVWTGLVLAWTTALPWVLLPLNLPVCEHRFYGPLAGLCLVAAGSLPRRVASRRLQSRLRTAPWAAAATAVFALLSAERSLDFRDRETLWERTLEQHPDSLRGHCGLALALFESAAPRLQGPDREFALARIRRARDLVEQALLLYPQHVSARQNLAEFEMLLGDRGRPFVAIAVSDWLVRRAPDNPFHRLLLSRTLAHAAVRTGRPDLFAEAEEAALSCLQIAPPKGLVYRTAATARMLAGDLPGAVRLLDRSVARGLDHHSVLLHRAELLLQLDRRAEAELDLRDASRQPGVSQAALARLRARLAAPGR